MEEILFKSSKIGIKNILLNMPDIYIKITKNLYI
jgi:hypothetical protein